MKRSLKFVAVLDIISMVVMMGLPALAKGGKGKGKGQGQGKGRGGKPAVGVVTAYEPASNLLTASMKDGSTFSGTVAEDVKVKLDHRGNNGANKRKKPSNGDETDILPQAEILKMKLKCGEVTKLRLRAGTGVAPVEEPAVEAEPVEPAARMATEDDSDDCADETDDGSSEDGSDDLDEDLDGELDELDGEDGSTDDGAGDSGDAPQDGSGDGSGDVLDETVECVVTLLEDCA